MKKTFCVLIILLGGSTVALGSTCHGTTANGWLEDGVKLPGEGDNFVSYSEVLELAGRTYVHATVRDIILSSYAKLYRELPSKVFKYAETGFETGGAFSPHKTHQNGLSVDFMTPVIDKQGQSVHLPTHVLNKFGYDIEFDSKGNYDDYVIDYDAMAAHIVALHKEAKSRNVDIWRVIFAPELQPGLFKTKFGNYLKNNIQFSKKRSWVRHDEHYHIDFAIPCKK